MLRGLEVQVVGAYVIVQLVPQLVLDVHVLEAGVALRPQIPDQVGAAQLQADQVAHFVLAGSVR
jgi:hypothetical protein